MKNKSGNLVITLALGLGLTLALVWLLGSAPLPVVRAANFTVTKLTDTNDGTCDADCSLREAIVAANGNAEADSITLGAGTHVLTITGAGEDASATGDLDVTGTLTIIGAGPDQTTINANRIDRVFDIQPGVSTVVISGVTIFNGYVYGESGGGINNHWGADLTLINTIVLSNTADAPSLALGGGIMHSGGALTLTNASILSNTAVGRGGGLYVDDGSAVLSGALISNNSVTGMFSDRGGGGLYVRDSHVELHGGQIVSNSAEYDGGGVHIREGASFTQIGDTLIAYNVAAATDGSGGGVYVQGSGVTLGAAQILSNTARGGGGVCVNGGSVTLSGTHVISNYAATGGGGARIAAGRATLRNAHVLSNTAGSSGGGIYNSNEVSIDAVILSGNRANVDGGGVYNTGAITITNSTFSHNHATNPGSDGGALTNDGGAAVLTYTTIVSNTADRCSGGICVYNNGDVWLQNTLLAYNHNSGAISNCHTSLTSGGYITSTGHNLEDVDTCGFTADGDLPNTDPRLGPLTVDGRTLVHPLLVGSPAIDAGVCVPGITTDQRGQPRPNPASPFCDIGAYEKALVPVITLTKSGPAWFNLGTHITYTLHVTNTGLVTGYRVILTDTLPAGSSLAWASDGGVEVSGVVTWPVFSVPPNGGAITRSFAVTATDTITNADYWATAQGVSSVAGTVAVRTLLNHPPVAEAGAPQTVRASDAVQLDGSGSSDPDGHSPSYRWQQTDGTAVTLNDASAISPTFTAPTTPGMLTFTLTVTDTFGLADSDATTVTVEMACPKPLTGVTIGGPTSGEPNTVYTFTATVTPSGGTEPITHTWSPEPESGQDSASVQYIWTTTGIQTITVNAQNCGGADSDTYEIEVTGAEHHIYLPLVVRNL